MKYATKNLLCIAITCIAVIMFTSCAHKEAFTKSVVVPGASGKVKVKKDNNNNYAISVSVRDLTPAEKLIPAKQDYVVWSETNNGVRNIGQLISSRSLLARGYKASLDAVSPFKPVRVFITAEDDASTQYPGPQVVLTTENF